jgi:outer membrane protein OmpA-like peptidoglycan-associated protein
MLASDAVLVQGRDWEMAAAAEIWYHDIIGVRAGYQKNNRDLGDFSFGMSLRWDDVINSILGRPTRFGDAIEIDFAGADYGNALQETYRGAFSHYPVAPEPFRFEESGILMAQVMGQTSVVTLRWEKARDPDPFDEVTYLILVDKDKSRIDEAIRWVERDMAGFLSSSLKDSLLACESLPGTEYSLPVNEGGVYHWAVAAYDLRQHARLAKRGRELVKQFVVETADLIVQDIEFFPTPWITTTPEQGTLTVTAANQSIAVRDSFRLVVTDEFLFANADERAQETVLLDVIIPGMRVQQDTTFTIAWSTQHQGLHRIRAMMDPDSSIFELKKDNNTYHEVVVSVPKGVLAAPDTVEVVSTEYDYIEIPLVPEIYFDPHTSTMKPEYYADGDALPPVLLTLSQRLQDHPNVTLSVMGAIDRLSGENDPSLADRRAENVKGQLVSLGVPESQIIVLTDHPGKILGQRRPPVDPQDAMWVMEQNRMVTFAVPQQYEEAIFGPHKLDVETTIRDSVSFDVRVVSPGEIAAWGVYGTAVELEITREGLTHEQHLDGVFVWNGMDRSDVLVPRNRWYGYALVVTDTLDRTFRTPADSVYMLERRTIRRHEVFGAAKFAQTQPVYQFYWDRLMNLAQEFIQNRNMRIRFEGHACAVGPDRVNERLSFRRAEQFTQAFRERLEQAYPDGYREALLRIEAPVGFGEKEPMRVKLRATGEEVLLGDNQSPVGRYLNRRIMVALFREY